MAGKSRPTVKRLIQRDGLLCFLLPKPWWLSVVQVWRWSCSLITSVFHEKQTNKQKKKTSSFLDQKHPHSILSKGHMLHQNGCIFLSRQWSLEICTVGIPGEGLYLIWIREVSIWANSKCYSFVLDSRAQRIRTMQLIPAKLIYCSFLYMRI